ncbi:MAG: hypothetical protein ACKO38_02425, partial [Planctomycetota bacterium]
GGGAASTLSGTGREDDTLAVEDSSEGRRISESMLDYWAAFMRTGTPDARAWPQKVPAWRPESASPREP